MKEVPTVCSPAEGKTTSTDMADFGQLGDDERRQSSCCPDSDKGGGHKKWMRQDSGVSGARQVSGMRTQQARGDPSGTHTGKLVGWAQAGRLLMHTAKLGEKAQRHRQGASCRDRTIAQASKSVSGSGCGHLAVTQNLGLILSRVKTGGGRSAKSTHPNRAIRRLRTRWPPRFA